MSASISTQQQEDEDDDDVCCVGCGERVCGFTEEPPHKDRKGEAVCDDCWIDDQDEDDPANKITVNSVLARQSAQ